MEETLEKSREDRVRRQIKRMGYVLLKSRCRDPQAPERGRFCILNQNWVYVAGYGPWSHSMTLDDVERWVADRA